MDVWVRKEGREGGREKGSEMVVKCDVDRY